MKPLVFALTCLAASIAFAGTLEKKAVEPLQDDGWKFSLSAPGWMQGMKGTVGIDGIDSHIDMGFDDIVNKIDMALSLRAEASKGRFGMIGDVFYASVSDSLGVGGPLQKIDVRLDETLADFAFRWRLIEGERGFIDLLAGLRYTNIYQSLHLQSDDAGVGQTSADLVEDISDAIRDRLAAVLSEGDFRNGISEAVTANISSRLAGLGPEPKRRSVGIGPLGGRHALRTALVIEEIVSQVQAELQAEVAALQATGAARAAEVRRRIESAKGKLEKRIADALDTNLNRSFSRDDDWWDPYVGVRARLNFTPAFYLTARGDIGGFGVGSDLMWQAEGAFGVQLTRSIHAEAGYRALSFDYEGDGLTFDAIMHGAQVTVGITF